MASSIVGIVEGFRKRSKGVGLLDQLDHFRSRLIWIVAAILICTVIGFVVVVNYGVLGLVVAPIVPFIEGSKLKYFGPMDPFVLTLKLAVCLGVALAFPFVLYQVWQTVSPLMRPEERKLAIPTIVGSVFLFLVGAVFCYFLVLPLMFRFTLGFQTEGLRQSIVATEYIKVVVRMFVAFGLSFELPIIILMGTVLGIVTPEFLASKRRYAFAIVTVVSALVTPPDLSSMVLLLVPMWILYELSIVISRVIVRRRPPELSPDGTGWAG